MFDPSSLRQLINEHGITLTLRKKVAGAYDVATGTVSQTSTDYIVKGYFFNNDPSVAEFNNQMMGERRMVVSDKLNNGTVTPEIDATDEIVFGGKITTVTRVTKISSSSSIMCQLLYLRD